MKRHLLISLFAVCLAVPAAQAGIVYVGASAGSTSLDAQDFSFSVDDSDTGYKAFVGVNILKFFGVEFAYVDLGAPEGTSGMSTVTVDAKGWNLSLLGRIPLWKFEIYGKAGLLAWDSDASFSDPMIPAVSDDGSDLSYGVGAKFKFTDHFAIRAEWETFDVEDVDSFDLTSAGLEFTF
jgi:OOP family OmpA-OmpF porin